MDFENTIGLETHVQLKTRTKMFCGCLLKTGCEPNVNVCPVCLGYPGALPMINREAVKLTVMSGLMLGCEINRHATFDRKNYFYPDMAKDYQISENGNPLCIGGGVTIETPNGPKTIRINHIHLEEDAAKINHYSTTSGVDFNRGGTPLMEIVSEPDMANADEAIAYLTALKEMLVYAGVSDCNLEEGNMRSDVNISIRPMGAERLGTKVEIKNMNSFRGIHAALEYEARRQRECMAHSIPIVQETRRWDGEALETASMRSKENAHDYRYFPEPDLVPLALGRRAFAAQGERGLLRGGRGRPRQEDGEAALQPLHERRDGAPERERQVHRRVRHAARSPAFAGGPLGEGHYQRPHSEGAAAGAVREGRRPGGDREGARPRGRLRRVRAGGVR